MVQRAIGESLKLLGRIASSETLERLGVSGSLEKLLYRGSKFTVSAASEAIRRARPVVKLLEPERMPSKAAPPSSGLFDLTLNESQQLVHDTMVSFAKDSLRPNALHADEQSRADPGLLQQAHELGLTQLSVPEALGGVGETRSVMTNVLVTEDLARGDMGLALAALAPVAVVNALVDFGTAEQQGSYLPAFIGEQFYPAALALLEARPLFDPHHLATRASLAGGDYVISGEKSLVPLAEHAELLLVMADLAGKPQAFLVDRGAPGLSIEREPSMGLRAAELGRVRLDHVRVPRDNKLGGDTGIDAERIIDLARIAWGAMTLGTCDAMLDYVKSYARERTAFGEPIAYRQSVAFAIADIALELDAMRLMVYRAASRAEQGKSFRREAQLARIQCAEKGMQIGTNGVQLLGGHGFIKEHPVELWYRQLRAIGILEGALLV
jgi:alkylation response protein AidB-like acyl-CoA dehydrogenase